ncbi:hypothetical protein WG219_08310 [Ectopseudomonas mendocina]|uniref:Uncharacterized protein n=1 Tax=Ectopseudomonas mendocina TaxID=300 RepID=A0ABZ2RKZ2_ECTME
MQAISDKIRHYRKTFRPLLVYALGTRVVWLSVLLITLIVGLLLINVILRRTHGFDFLSVWQMVIFLCCEMMLLPACFQVYFEGAQRRYRMFNPNTMVAGFRNSHRDFDQEKLRYIRATFAHEGDLRELVKSLVEEWEWRRELKARGQEPMWRKAMGFFSLPSASNFAAYMTGLMAVIAGIVIASIDRELLFVSFEQLVKDVWDLISLMWVNLIPIVVMAIVPGAIIISACRYLWELFLEWLDDQYLGQAGFYRFISDVLDLHDRGERDLMRKTRGRVYWAVRLGMAPLEDVPRVWSRIKRAKRLAKRNVRGRLRGTDLFSQPGD